MSLSFAFLLVATAATNWLKPYWLFGVGKYTNSLQVDKGCLHGKYLHLPKYAQNAHQLQHISDHTDNQQCCDITDSWFSNCSQVLLLQV